MQALVAGTAASGAFISLLRIGTKAALPATPAGLQTSAGAAAAGQHMLCNLRGRLFP